MNQQGRKKMQFDEKEVWKDIIGYEGKYQISNYGRVKSLPREKKVGYVNTYITPEIILKTYKSKKGYLNITLSKNGKCIDKRNHILVAQHFIPNPNNKPQVNHKDGNKLNNNVENLEWVTNDENIQHAWKLGLYKLKIERLGELNVNNI